MKIPDRGAVLGSGNTFTSTITKSQTQESYAKDDTLYPDLSPPVFRANHSLGKNALGKEGLDEAQRTCAFHFQLPHTHFLQVPQLRGTHFSRILCRRACTRTRPLRCPRPRPGPAPAPEANKRFVILRRVAKEGGPIPSAWVLQSRPFRVTHDAVSVVDPASELRGIDRDVQAPPSSPGRGPLGKSWGRGGGGTNSQGS